MDGLEYNLRQDLNIVLGLLIVAMAVALVVRRLRVPYTVILVLVGLGLAFTGLVPGLQLKEEHYAVLCFNLLLPPLLFEAALNLKWEHFARNARSIFTLALPGTLVSIGLVGLGCHLLLGLPPLTAFLLGSIICPTDPFSVLAIFRELGVAKRLSVVLEGESLFNDAVGVVIFTILLPVALLEADPSLTGPTASLPLWSGLSTFVVMTVGGVLVGAGLGYVASRLTRSMDDHLIEVTLSTILCYGSFLAAEQLRFGGHHFSGVIAVVVAGLLMGNYGRATGMSATTVVALHNFWEYATFVINSAVFLLIGAELHVLPTPTAATVGRVVVVFLVLLGARAFVCFVAGPLLSRVAQPIPVPWRYALTWGGLKGALSMVMVLQTTGLREGYPFLLAATFGVVFLSLMLQGLTIRRVVQALGLVGRSEAIDQYEALAAETLASRAALEELQRLRDTHVLTPRLYEAVAAEYRERREQAAEEIDQLHLETEELERLRLYEAKRAAHHAAKGAILDAFHRGIIAEDTLQDAMAAINARHQALEAEHDALGDQTPA